VSDDPLTSFIARSLRAEVSEVRSELVTKNAAMEIERIRFRQAGEARTLVVKRVPPADSLEVQLLPFLARRAGRAVPNIRSRGIPPPAVPAWPWVLMEDVIDARSACHGDAAAIVRAKESIERAVAQDQPALRALGVPTRTAVQVVERVAERSLIDRPLDAEARTAAATLATLPLVLCHGDLVCANARQTDRGVVLLEWRRAHLGCGLLDIARLESDVAAFSGEAQGEKLFDLYGELTGVEVTGDQIRASRLVDRATRTASTD
jgi:phosphotransferase family enzyme